MGGNLLDRNEESAVRPRRCALERQHERDAGLRDGVTTAERERIKTLEREVREILPQQGRLDRHTAL